MEKFVFLLFLINHHLLDSNAWRSFDVVIKNVRPEVHSKRMSKFEVTLKPTPKTSAALFFKFRFNEDVNVTKVRVIGDYTRDGKPVRLYDHTLNPCDMMKVGRSSFNIVHVVLDQVLDPKFTNIPKECPFKKDAEYYVNGVYYDANKLPPFMPNMIFNTSSTFGDEKEIFVQYMINGEFRSKNEGNPDRKRRKMGKSK